MATSSVSIVNAHDVAWETYVGTEHVQSIYSVLSKDMVLGVNIERIDPGKVSCPYHWHLRGDEFFLVLEGRAMLRHADGVTEVKKGDAISCPAGEAGVHQFYNPFDEPAQILMVGKNEPDDVCGYPDSGKVMIRGIKKVGRLSETEYMDGEPDPPIIKR